MAGEDEGATAAEEEEMAAMLDLSKKKKKKKKKQPSGDGEKAESSSGGTKSKKDDDDAGGGSNSGGSESDQRKLLALQEAVGFVVGEGANASPPEDMYDRRANYTYTELLDRVTMILQSNNPDLMDKKRRNLKPPQLTRVGPKKTLWVNFHEICTMMQRSPDHVFTFFTAELGTEGSIDGNQRLVLKGKYVAKYIESLLRKYIVEYVTCQMCRSPNTNLVKDSSSRLFFLNCRDCGSSRSVAPIRSGYHAVLRADRRAARNNAM